MISINRGKNWHELNRGVNDASVTAFRVSSSSPHFVIAQTRYGLYRLIDSDLNWANDTWKNWMEEDQRIKQTGQSYQEKLNQDRSQTEASPQIAQAKPFESLRQTAKEIIGKDRAPMVLVPAGEFLMGSKEGGILGIGEEGKAD